MCSKVQTVEKVVEIPQVGQTLQGTTQEVDIPLAPRREAPGGSSDPGNWDAVSSFGDADFVHQAIFW